MYQKSVDEVLKHFKIEENKGLTSKQVSDNKWLYGKNELEKQEKESLIQIIFQQVKSVLIIILCLAGIVSFILGEFMDGCIIFFVIILNTCIGVFQERKAKHALEALELLTRNNATVIREGSYQQIDASDIVVGDLVVIEEGNVVPCDMRLITCVKLEIDESILTGESKAIWKQTKAIKEKVDIYARNNMAFMSTFVTSGRGIGVCTQIGMNTEVGKIAQMLKEPQRKLTPLQIRLNHLGTILGALCVGVCIVMVVIGLFQKRDVFTLIMSAISLAVAIIPEGLSAIVTIVLALGVEKMSKESAIIKHLMTVETLGCTNVICTDKTGTLTKNEMRVSHAYSSLCYEASDWMLKGIVLCNNAQFDKKWFGEALEVGLVKYAKEQGIEKNEMEMMYPRIDEIPFSSKRKMMTTIHKDGAKYLSFTKGAIDYLIDSCDFMELNHVVVPMLKEYKEQILKRAQENELDGLRLIGICMKHSSNLQDNFEKNMIFLGFVGLIDPPRENVQETIETCQKAGIHIKMITGDALETAYAIGKKIGICENMKEVISGQKIDDFSDEQLQEHIDEYTVFARVNPSHKMRLVEALQAKGNVVCMSGDGVNDAPSIQKADIGVSMGKNGSDVAKQASDMILVDDNLNSIVSAIKSGRVMYLNIQKAIVYLLSCNFGELMTIMLAMIFLKDYPSPLLPIQILWVNLLTDSLPSLCLGVNPVDDEVMHQLPRNKKTPLLSIQTWVYIIGNGLLIGVCSLVSFRVGLEESAAIGQTMAFMVLSIAQLFHSLNFIYRTKPIIIKGIWANKLLCIVVMISILLQIGICELTPLQMLLKTSSLNLFHWAIVFLLSCIIILVNDLVKLITNEQEVVYDETIKC